MGKVSWAVLLRSPSREIIFPIHNVSWATSLYFLSNRPISHNCLHICSKKLHYGSKIKTNCTFHLFSHNYDNDAQYCCNQSNVWFQFNKYWVLVLLHTRCRKLFINDVRGHIVRPMKLMKPLNDYCKNQEPMYRKLLSVIILVSTRSWSTLNFSLRDNLLKNASDGELKSPKFRNKPCFDQQYQGWMLHRLLEKT